MTSLLHNLRVRLTVWRYRLGRRRNAKIVAAFPGAGIALILVDLCFSVTDPVPVIGFVLTRGGELKPVTADGVYGGDDVPVLLYPSGEVCWPDGESWPTLLDFRNAMAEYVEQAAAAYHRGLPARGRRPKLVEAEDEADE